MTRVKVCGITNAPDRDATVQAGADAMGVISGVPVETPREVDAETAASLVADTPPFVTTVLVTMPDAVQDAVDRVKAVSPDVVQIHDGLTPAELGALSARVDASVLAVVDPSADDVDAVANGTDGLLVDSVDSAGAGGTGQTHDWDRTRDLVAGLDVPVILAGGLTPENVAQAVEIVQPFGVDVASGVESAGGRKDHDKIDQFVARAKGTAGASPMEGCQ